MVTAPFLLRRSAKGPRLGRGLRAALVTSLLLGGGLVASAGVAVAAPGAPVVQLQLPAGGGYNVVATTPDVPFDREVVTATFASGTGTFATTFATPQTTHTLTVTGGDAPVSVTVTLSDDSGATYSPATTVTVPDIHASVSGHAPDILLNTSPAFSYLVSGPPAPTVSVLSGALPPGISIASQGHLFGVAAAAGTYAFTLEASYGTDVVGLDADTMTVEPLQPSPPTGVSAIPGNDSATVQWTAPGDDGGAPISDYTIDAVDQTNPTGDTTLDGAVSPQLVNGLTPGDSYVFTVVAANGGPTPSDPSAASSPVVIDGAPSITGTPGGATVSSSYAYAFAVAGTPAPTVSKTSGQLPPGLSLSPAGVLSGTPTEAGSYDFGVTASNGVAPDALLSTSITVAPTNPDAPTGVSAVAGNGSARVSWTHGPSDGGAPLTGYSVSAIDQTDAAGDTTTSSPTNSVTVTGLTPGDSYVFEVSASNGTLSSAESAASLPVVIGGSPTLSGVPTAATVGVPYSFAFSTSGSPAPTVTRTSGTLPPGLTLSGSGVLSGTPTTAGSYSFGLTASNGFTPVATLNAGVSVAAVAPGAPTGVNATAGNAAATVSWTAPSFTGGTSLTGYTVTATDQTAAANSPAPQTVSASTVSTTFSVLKPGDSYVFVVTASNSAGPSAPSTPSAPVTPFLQPALNGTPPAATAGTVYSFTYTVSGFPAPTVQLASGTLPPGLALGSSGTITGTPTTAGTYGFSISASNGHSPAATSAGSITVSPGAAATVTATSGSNQAGTAKVAFDKPLVATVTDAEGNPVPNVPVTFTVASGSVTFPAPTPGTATVTTNAAGVATSPTLIAGSASGPATVKATTGTAVPATFAETVVSTLAARSDLQVSISAPASVTRGATFTATVTVKNAGPNTASGILTVVALGPGVSVASAGGGSAGIGTVTYSADSLPVGGSVTYMLTLKTLALPLPYLTTLSANALSGILDPDLLNNLSIAAIKAS